jgi:hypothetical protein
MATPVEGTDSRSPGAILGLVGISGLQDASARCMTIRKAEMNFIITFA